MSLRRDYRLVVGAAESPSLNALAGAFNWTGAAAQFAFGGFAGSIYEAALDGTAQANADEINDNLAAGSAVWLPPGEYSFVPPIVIPNGAALVGAGPTSTIGSTTSTLLRATDGASTDAMMVNAVAGEPVRGCYIGDLGLRPQTAQAYDGIRFDGIENSTLFALRVRFVPNCLRIRNAYNDPENFCARGLVIREIYFDDQTDTVLRVERNGDNQGPSAPEADLSVFGWDSPDPDVAGTFIELHDLGKTMIVAESFTWSLQEASDIAVNVTNCPGLNLLFSMGGMRGRSGDVIVNIDSADHNISALNLQTGVNTSPQQWPDLLIDAPGTADDVNPNEDGIPTVLLNGRTPVWAS